MSSSEVVDQYARLAADPAYVRLEGLHCVKHALRFGAEVALLLTTDREATIGLASLLAPDLRSRLLADLVEIRPDQIDQVMGAQRFDVLGLARRPSPAGPPGNASATAPAVLLEDPRNLGNLGAVVRAAAGLGARGVRTTGTVDPWHPTVLRAAAGLHFAIPVERVEPTALTGAGDGPLLALDPAGVDLRGVTVADDAVLAFGSERHGVSPRLRRAADQLVSIPMREHVSSYNLATAVAITLFHWKSAGGTAPDAR